MKTDGNDRIDTVVTGQGSYTNVSGGLTKREYFAAMAMRGMLASTPGCVSESVAVFAVKEADALINELNKEKSE